MRTACRLSVKSNREESMDWDTCNHKKLNQRLSEAKRWNAGDPQPNTSKVKRGKKVQPTKRKKRAAAAKITELEASYCRQTHLLPSRVVDRSQLSALASVARHCVEEKWGAPLVDELIAGQRRAARIDKDDSMVFC
jgi:hypothetical protein